MAHLRQLAEPDSYQPCDWDLKADAAGRQYWVDAFRWHLDAVVLPLVKEQYPDAPPERLATFRTEYRRKFEEIAEDPERYERLDMLYFTELRWTVQGPLGFDDPFRKVKQRENESALALYPGVLAELDAAGRVGCRTLLAQGLMAGNIFDLGSKAAIERYQDGQAAFRAARAALPSQPWFIDDTAAWWARWDASPESVPAYQHVVFFVDNAGGDILLGCLPMVRWLLQAGARVTLAANTLPALNDVTAAELLPLVERCAEMDAVMKDALASGALRVMATGSRAPLLHLGRLTDEFVAATADADLIILHGMGRSIESNFHVPFVCDVLRVSALKDERVAERIGARLFDCVFRWVPCVTSGDRTGAACEPATRSSASH